MSDHDEQTGVRLERLLRQWGADQAVAESAEQLPPLIVSRGPGRLRWLGLSAAAVLALAVGIGLALVSADRGRLRIGQDDRLAELEAELAAERAQHGRTLRQLAAKEQGLSAAMIEAQRQTARLADFQKKFDRLAVATDRSAAAAQVRSAAVRDELRQQYLLTIALMRRMYLGPESSADRIVVRQRAMKRNRLLARCANVRRSVNGQAALRAVESAEVLLTRLELADPGLPGRAADALAAAVAKAGVVERIEAVILAGGQPEAVTAWLFESQLVLTGLSDAS